MDMHELSIPAPWSTQWRHRKHRKTKSKRSSTPAPSPSSTETKATKDFPKHWGPPPNKQTRDVVTLPAGYGTGSSTLAAWIEKHMTDDTLNSWRDTSYRLRGFGDFKILGPTKKCIDIDSMMQSTSTDDCELTDSWTWDSVQDGCAHLRPLLIYYNLRTHKWILCDAGNDNKAIAICESSNKTAPPENKEWVRVNRENSSEQIIIGTYMDKERAAKTRTCPESSVTSSTSTSSNQCYLFISTMKMTYEGHNIQSDINEIEFHAVDRGRNADNDNYFVATRQGESMDMYIRADVGQNKKLRWTVWAWSNLRGKLLPMCQTPRKKGSLIPPKGAMWKNTPEGEDELAAITKEAGLAETGYIVSITHTGRPIECKTHNELNASRTSLG